jgi:cell wall assembly regulator SMI1
MAFLHYTHLKRLKFTNVGKLYANPRWIPIENKVGNNFLYLVPGLNGKRDFQLYVPALRHRNDTT